LPEAGGIFLELGGTGMRSGIASVSLLTLHHKPTWAYLTILRWSEVLIHTESQHSFIFPFWSLQRLARKFVSTGGIFQKSYIIHFCTILRQHNQAQL
jgi:hypothetical protein